MELTHTWAQNKTKQNAIPCCRNWIGNLNQQNEWKLKREGSPGKGIRLKHRNLGTEPSQREGDWAVILLRFDTFTWFLRNSSRFFFNSVVRTCVCIFPTPLLKHSGLFCSLFFSSLLPLNKLSWMAFYTSTNRTSLSF